MFSGCFKVFFSIVRHLSRELDFWAENQIFKKFLKSLKTCLVGVFWVFHGFFLALFDIWAENQIFEPRTVFSKHFLKASKHVSLVLFSECFMAFLALFDIWAENRILSQERCFYKFRKMTQNIFNQHAINCRALLIDKLVMNPGLSYVRITTSYIKYRAENHVIPTRHMTHSKCRRPPGQWWLATTLHWAMSLYFKFRYTYSVF